MRIIDIVRLNLRTLLRRGQLERELDDELRFHLDMQTEENLRAGMSAEDARRHALLMFGGVEGHKEASRDTRALRKLEEWGSDIRYAARALRRSPAFTITAVLTLALGIGANAALFGLLNALFFRMPAGVPETDRLAWINTGRMIRETSYADYQDFVVAAAPAFSGIAAYSTGSMALATPGEPLRVSGQLVSSNFFGVLGARPLIGRGFLPEEASAPGASAVVVLGERLWRERFGAEAGLIGEAVVLNGHPFTVVGVAPQDFVGVSLEEPADLWVPATMQPVALPRGAADVFGNRRISIFQLIGRLREGSSLEEASSVVDVAAGRVSALEPERQSPLTADLVPLRGWVPIEQAKGILPIVGFAWIITALVLVIACANVANLLLSRAVARRREIGIRLALGVGRGRLIRLLMTEALLLALAGGAVGVTAAYWGATWFRLSVFGPWGTLDVTPDARSLVFTFGLSALTGVLFGLVPAWRASRPQLAPTLKGDAPSWLRRTRTQDGLVVVQLALSLVLLVAATLFVQKLWETRKIDLGFQPENVLALSFDLEVLGYAKDERAAFESALRERLLQLPTVEAVTVPSYIPMTRGAMLESAALPSGDSGGEEAACAASVAVMGVGTDYFRTLGIGLRGRGIEERDAASGARPVVVSSSLAKACWPGEDPLGKQLRLGGGPAAELREVIGVAQDIVVSSPDDRDRPHAYIPSAQAPSMFATSDVNLLIRSAGDLTPLLGVLRAEFRRMNPHLPISTIRPLGDVVDERLGFQRRLTAVLAAFGGIALVLAALGLYGVIAFTVAGRTREIGVRIALGASPRRVVSVFLREGARLTVVGLLVGGAFSYGVARLIGAAVEGISVTDPLPLVAVAAILAMVSMLACWLPARRATHIEAVEALRSE